jgi:hypothetical protein
LLYLSQHLFKTNRKQVFSNQSVGLDHYKNLNSNYLKTTRYQRLSVKYLQRNIKLAHKIESVKLVLVKKRMMLNQKNNCFIKLNILIQLIKRTYQLKMMPVLNDEEAKVTILKIKKANKILNQLLINRLSFNNRVYSFKNQRDSLNLVETIVILIHILL